MAGSRAWYVYVDDDETEYGVQLDEDTGASDVLGFEPYTGTPALTQLPKGTEMRYVNCVQTTGQGAGFRNRPFPCGTRDADAFSGDAPTFEINGLTYSVTSTRGEKSRKPTATNTGLVGESSEVGGGDGSVDDGGGTP